MSLAWVSYESDVWYMKILFFHQDFHLNSLAWFCQCSYTASSSIHHVLVIELNWKWSSQSLSWCQYGMCLIHPLRHNACPSTVLLRVMQQDALWIVCVLELPRVLCLVFEDPGSFRSAFLLTQASFWPQRCLGGSVTQLELSPDFLFADHKGWKGPVSAEPFAPNLLWPIHGCRLMLGGIIFHFTRPFLSGKFILIPRREVRLALGWIPSNPLPQSLLKAMKWITE